MNVVQWEKVAQSAERVQISQIIIRAAVKAGDLPAYPVGKGSKEYRLDPSEVDAWMKSRSWEPRSA